MGRDKIPYGKKKKSIRIWAETEAIENLGSETIKIECTKLISKLQSDSLTKCADEVLKGKLTIKK